MQEEEWPRNYSKLVHCVFEFAQNAEAIGSLVSDLRFTSSLFTVDDDIALAQFIIDWHTKYQQAIPFEVLKGEREQYVSVNYVDPDTGEQVHPEVLPPVPYVIEKLVDWRAEVAFKQVIGDVIRNHRGAEAVQEVLKGLSAIATNGNQDGATIRIAYDRMVEGEPEPPTYIVQELLLQGGITTFGGHSGAGKTPTELAMVRAILSGEDFLGFRTRVPEGNVVFATQEPAAKFEFYMARAGLNKNTPNMKKLRTIMLEDNTHVRWETLVGDAAKEAGIGGVLILDPALDFSDADDENSSTQIRDMYKPLVKATADHELGCLVTAHTTKGFKDKRDSETGFDDIRGSSGVVANSSIIVLLKRSSEVAGFNYVSVDRNKVQYPWAAPFYTRLDTGGPIWVIGRADEADVIEAGNLEVRRKLRQEDERVLQAVVSLNGEGSPTTHDRIARRGKIRKSAIGESLGRLVAQGRIVAVPVVLRDGSTSSRRMQYEAADGPARSSLPP